MKLSITSRKTGTKGIAKKLRREGQIPAILYGTGHANKEVSLKRDEIQAVLRSIRQGLLSTTVFELVEGSHTHKAMIKEIQYHPVSYAILHIDFALVSDKAPVTVNVPIQITGAAESIGVKGGGFMRHVIRSLKVSCALKDMPQELTLDIRDLDVAGSKRLSDIQLAPGIKPLAKMNEVAVVIAKKA
jgi:large subunit ribosomal protein L25